MDVWRRRETAGFHVQLAACVLSACILGQFQKGDALSRDLVLYDLA
jgi:hypothetical protein